MNRPTSRLVPVVPLLTLTLSACPGDGKDYECDRPSGSPVERGFVGDAGADGCDGDMACASEPGAGGGSCVEAATAQCVLDGLGAGTGTSKDCAEDEVCVVPDGDWYGTCAAWTETVADFSGTVTCEAPLSSTLEVQQGELLSFSLVSGPTDSELFGANVWWEIADQDGTMNYNGNPIGEFGVATTETVTMDRAHLFQADATLTWTTGVDQCQNTPFEAEYTRVYGPQLQISEAAAMPLAKGETATGTLSCVQTAGDGSIQDSIHYYILDGEAGDVLDLRIEAHHAFDDSDRWLGVTLGTADGYGSEAGVSGFVDSYFEGVGEASYELPFSGTFYLRVIADWTSCDQAHYTLSY